MRINSPGTILVLKRASLGPAAMALRASRMTGRTSNYLTHPAGGFLVRGGSMGYLGAAGENPTTTAVKGGVATYAGSTAGTAAGPVIASYVGAGSAVGPIGAAVGLVVGIAVGALLKKNYLNVPQMNAAQDAQVNAFKQYSQIAGRAPGRAYGLDVMEQIWNGAVHAGAFPKNNRRQCFHEGCAKYPGDGSWISGAVHGGRGTGQFSLPYAWSQMKSAPPPAGPSMATWNPNVPTRSVQPVGRGGYTFRPGPLRGFGAVGFRDFGTLGQYGSPEAITLIDQYFIPANQADNPPWAVPASPLEHQLLYDVADAWLAQNAGVTTTPNVGAPAGGAVPVRGTQPGAGTPGSSNPLSPGYNYGAGGPTDVGGGGNVLVPVTNPVTGKTEYVPAGPTTPTTAGLSALPGWSWLLIAAGVAFALARPEKKT